jgi:hypothetical protein
MTRHRHHAGRNELSFQTYRNLLGKFLRFKSRPEGFHAPGLENFKENPFDPRLRTHKIHRLSARYGRTIYAVDIENDLRAVFFIEGDSVITVDIGTHDIYKG